MLKEELIDNWNKHNWKDMHGAMLYEIRILYMRTNFLSQKDAKVRSKVGIKGHKNTVNVYSMQGGKGRILYLKLFALL